ASSIYNNSNFWNYAIMPNPPIHIVVEHGRVTLTGVVQSEVDRMLARALSARGLDLVTFNFPYTEQGRRIPDRAPVLESCYRAVIEAVRAELESARHALYIGGKSMGGRIATQVAAADSAL